jgi:hypothetical protein
MLLPDATELTAVPARILSHVGHLHVVLHVCPVHNAAASARERANITFQQPYVFLSFRANFNRTKIINPVYTIFSII